MRANYGPENCFLMNLLRQQTKYAKFLSLKRILATRSRKVPHKNGITPNCTRSSFQVFFFQKYMYPDVFPALSRSHVTVFHVLIKEVGNASFLENFLYVLHEWSPVDRTGVRQSTKIFAWNISLINISKPYETTFYSHLLKYFFIKNFLRIEVKSSFKVFNLLKT